MTCRTIATFECDLPDDAQWSENDDLLRPGGENVAIEIHAGLAAQGHACEEVRQRSFYGWEFESVLEGTTFHVVLQAYGLPQWLLICEPRHAWWRFRAPKTEETVDKGLSIMHHLLSRNLHFSRISWHDRDAFDRGEDEGTETPSQ